MKTKYVLWCKSSGDYNGKDGKRTEDLQKAALFTSDQVVDHAEQFQPNFEFLEVTTKGKVTLVF